MLHLSFQPCRGIMQSCRPQLWRMMKCQISKMKHCQMRKACLGKAKSTYWQPFLHICFTSSFLPLPCCLQIQNAQEQHILFVVKSPGKKRMVWSSFSFLMFLHLLCMADQVSLVPQKSSSVLFTGTIMTRKVMEKQVKPPKNEKRLLKMHLLGLLFA